LLDGRFKKYLTPVVKDANEKTSKGSTSRAGGGVAAALEDDDMENIAPAPEDPSDDEYTPEKEKSKRKRPVKTPTKKGKERSAQQYTTARFQEPTPSQKRRCVGKSRQTPASGARRDGKHDSADT
jgi:hypothetical protein